MLDLPEPSAQAQEHSQALQSFIQKRCQEQSGKLSFKTFMQHALYAPGLGYYSAGTCKFGPEGDFVTAPEISPLFGQSLSYAIDAVLNKLPVQQNPSILELGAGTGKLAADILENLAVLPIQYFILEISADLIARQQKYLENRLPSNLFNKIQWINQLPQTPFSGVILANEVMDAMPVHKFKIQNNQTHQEYYVQFNAELNCFEWHLDAPSTPELSAGLLALSDRFPEHFSEPFTSEINTDLQPWLAGLADSLEQGVIILIDYGFPEQEYYHPQRSQGTLMCHYRHRNHTDVFQYVGLSDITAHVDFSALAHAAIAVGLEVSGFTSQGAYLLDNNLTHFAQNSLASAKNPYVISQQIQQLTSPHEMGELFKVMVLSKHWDHELTGFRLSDQRGRL